MKTNFKIIGLIFTIIIIGTLFFSTSNHAEAATVTSIYPGDITVTNGVYKLTDNYSGVITIGSTATEVTVIGSVYHHGETRIFVAGGRTGPLTLIIENLNMTAPTQRHGIDFGSGGNYEHQLLIRGENTVHGGENSAGIHVPANVQLVINKADYVIDDNDAELIVIGGRLGAGIGGGYYGAGGTITISGGMVTVTGGDSGAGIGGGYYGAGGDVTISGGVVNAAGGEWAAGIGGGRGQAGNNVLIKDGMVTVTGGLYGAGIGGGYTGAGGTITISGGTVTGTGGDWGAGIGGGHSGAAGVITISGGVVEATGGIVSAGIGDGLWGQSGVRNITISGGTIIASGGISHPGIGFHETDGIITIIGNPTVIAIKGDYASDIGSIGSGTTTLKDDLGNDLTYTRLELKNNEIEMPGVIITVNETDYVTNETGLTGFFRKVSDTGGAIGIKSDQLNVDTNVIIASNGQSATVTIDLADYVPILSGLSLSNITLAPEFSQNETSYTLTVANNVASTIITPTVGREALIITVNDECVNNGDSSKPIGLAVGLNIIYIKVTALDGSHKTYSLSVYRLSQAPFISIRESMTLESEQGKETVNIKVFSSSIQVNDTKATVTVSKESITEGINILQDTIDLANQSNLTITIPNTTKQEIEVTLPEGILKAAADGKIDNIKVSTELAEFTFSPNTFGEAAKEKELCLKAKTVSKEELSLLAQANLPEGAVVIDLNIFVGGEKANKFISPIKVSVPYTLKENDKPGYLTVYLLKDDGTVEAVGGQYNPDTGKVTFRASHFSLYFISLGTPKPFTDLENVGWAKEAIDIMSAKGYIGGRSETEYDPSTNISRAEVAALMSRLLRISQTEGSQVFTDVLPDAWYYDNVQAAYGNGLVAGRSETQFEPERAITRTELAVIISRVLQNFRQEQYNADILTQFTDWESIPEWAIQNVSLTVASGIIKGSEGHFYPEKNATRAEVAVMLYRLLEKIN